MHRLIAEEAGHRALAESMRFVDHTTYDLERLDAERAAEQRRAACESAPPKTRAVLSRTDARRRRSGPCVSRGPPLDRTPGSRAYYTSPLHRGAGRGPFRCRRCGASFRKGRSGARGGSPGGQVENAGITPPLGGVGQTVAPTVSWIPHPNPARRECLPVRLRCAGSSGTRRYTPRPSARGPAQSAVAASPGSRPLCRSREADESTHGQRRLRRRQRSRARGRPRRGGGGPRRGRPRGRGRPRRRPRGRRRHRRRPRGRRRRRGRARRRRPAPPRRPRPKRRPTSRATTTRPWTSTRSCTPTTSRSRSTSS